MGDVPKHDPDVIPPTPFWPPGEWPATHEVMVGVGEIRDLTPDRTDWTEYDEVKHFHRGPLGFVPADHYVKGGVVRRYKRRG